ncbi:MAG: DUF6783 domain-containing protein [Enterocloster aldenensis]
MSTFFDIWGWKINTIHWDAHLAESNFQTRSKVCPDIHPGRIES